MDEERRFALTLGLYAAGTLAMAAGQYLTDGWGFSVGALVVTAAFVVAVLGLSRNDPTLLAVGGNDGGSWLARNFPTVALVGAVAVLFGGLTVLLAGLLA